MFYNYKKRVILPAMAAICGFMLFVSLDEAYGAQPESDVPPPRTSRGRKSVSCGIQLNEWMYWLLRIS